MTTPDWRTIDDTNQLIEFYPAANWQAFTDVNPASAGWVDIWDNSYHSSTQTNSTFFIQFHGDGIEFWSHIATGDNGQFTMRLDGGAPETALLNNTESKPRVPVWKKAGLTRGDHEITGRFVSTGPRGVGYVDSFAVHNSLYATDGFDLQSIGSAALDVPSNATVIDNEDPTVSYSGHWSHANNVEFYQHTTAWTTTPGDTFTFNFTGTAIWYYADLDPAHAPVSISVDGGKPDIAMSNGTMVPLSRRLIWSKRGLDYKSHTVVATHVGDTGRAISLDFFRVLGGNESVTSGDGKQQNSSSGTSAGVIAGSVMGAVALVSLAVMFLLWYRRKSQRKQSSPVLPDAWDPVGPRTTLRVEPSISTKGDRFVASQTLQTASSLEGDMEERAEGFGAASSVPVSIPLKGVISPSITAPSITASHTAQPSSSEPQEELEMLHSPAPPPYEQ